MWANTCCLVGFPNGPTAIDALFASIEKFPLIQTLTTVGVKERKDKIFKFLLLRFPYDSRWLVKIIKTFLFAFSFSFFFIQFCLCCGFFVCTYRLRNTIFIIAAAAAGCCWFSKECAPFNEKGGTLTTINKSNFYTIYSFLLHC